jgi:hypothetical protein
MSAPVVPAAPVPGAVPAAHAPAAAHVDPNFKPQPGRVGNLTEPQQTALDKLRTEVTAAGVFVPERMDDPTLLRYVYSLYGFHCAIHFIQLVANDGKYVMLRFLRARQFDVAKAKEMLLGVEQWRKDFGVDELVKSVLLLFSSYQFTLKLTCHHNFPPQPCYMSLH